MMTKKVNDMQRGPLASCIVFHDFSIENFDVMKWIDYSVSFFESVGLTPNRMGVVALEISSKSMVTFKGGLKQLDRINLENLQGIEIYANPSFDEKDNGENICSIHLDISPHKKMNTLVLACDNQLFPFKNDSINKTTKELANFFNPSYGYAYQRLFKLGPTWYPFGTIQGLEWGDKEEDAITKWLDEYRMSDGKYKSGDLRDIYPMNFLSKTHQNLKIDSLPFFEWIKADSKRGSLTELKESLWAWWVEPDNISYVREVLRPLGWMLAV
ncbi:MAG TPA: hypothetical protein PLY23_09640 [Alphaproteobacteria bacterium]|nr:hypothetical protein [Alphaproteobacteria bacterium]HQS94860.1 hypothetical protein [Alphaproteobacteria bacterium]